MMKMYIRLSHSFGVGILVLIALSPVAFADAEGDTKLGVEALRHDDLVEAEKYFRKAAEQNYTPAQVQLGELKHAAQENEEATGWFLMAAYQGDAAGAYDLGQMYISGDGVEPNLAKAVYWTNYSAEKNYLPAIEILVNAYRVGDLGLKVDLDKVKEWESKLIPLRAAAKKINDEKMAADIAAIRASYKAAAAKKAADETAAKKAADETAAKRVDNEDEAIAKKAAEITKPEQAK
jgi:TPR repeat protein